MATLYEDCVKKLSSYKEQDNAMEHKEQTATVMMTEAETEWSPSNCPRINPKASTKKFAPLLIKLNAGESVTTGTLPPSSPRQQT